LSVIRQRVELLLCPACLRATGGRATAGGLAGLKGALKRISKYQDRAMMDFDTKAFRQALGVFPTGVAVITTQSVERSPMGITVNSFSSASLTPPMVLWCISRSSDRFDAFTSARGYTVSILGTAHEAVSTRLAKQGAHSLAGIELIETPSGAPALADALAVFECESEAVHDAGDHAILLGRVIAFTRRERGAPLVFFRGRYGALANHT
jgi:flavin reductase (DIM6/NTAB) family NADH-FMN oxidoreductase RutF